MTIVLILAFLFILWILLRKPSHERNWRIGHDRLPKIKINKNELIIENFRDFDWKNKDEAEKKYRDEKFNLDDLEGLDMIFSYFYRFRFSAHVFWSFRFKNGKNVVISVEFRRKSKKGVPFLWPIRGLMNEFEIMYVVGSEKDLIGSRTNIRKERMYLYPMCINKEDAKRLLILISDDINIIYSKPAFYNTLFNNCVSVIIRRMEEVLNIKFPFSYKMVLPGFMDEVFYVLKLIPSEKPFGETRNYYRIDNNAVNKDELHYSSQIRKN